MFRLEIATDSAAFEDDPGAEIARILAFAAEQVSNYATNCPGANGFEVVRDYNGNRVGTWVLVLPVSDTTPTGIPIIGCETCGHTHPVTREHCPVCGLATLFGHEAHR